MVTISSVSHRFLNMTTTSFVTKTDAAPSDSAVSFPPNVKINISQDVKVKIERYMDRFVGNETGSRTIPDSVIMPPQSKILEMVKLAAKVEDQGESRLTSGHVSPASSASRSIISNQLLEIFASASVSIQNSGCGSGACSVQVSSNYGSSPASSAPSAGDGVNSIWASAEVRVGQVDEDPEACEAE
ncbi:hypothetical protein L249_4160 [Ophiocordyceps polyrhachis-furcata BCC 54312]|uniref:Uncharacterized protein n=1 Tax=Ophiocordyceps polyrhachis-furcata BCC 54312 TaxID=1330021 RepID=A0A367L5C4_9HYPO|nr:hypothetical protein L249_4160 [Ophiocordyceps polyrhachis-furcata BCC 54312]